MAASEVPVRESVGAALRFVRGNARFIGVAAAIGAGFSVAVAGLQMAAPALGPITSVLSGLVQAGVYAGLVSAALALGTGGLVANAARLWAAMVIIGFLLCIVMFVLSIPVAIALIAGPLGPYAGDLQGAGGDEARVLEIMTRFAAEQPVAVVVTALFFTLVWMLLTSRLYLAAPATVDFKRILTFETWAWTKGSTLRITAARLMLLAPAYVLVSALAYLIGAPLGIDVFNPASIMAVAQSNPIGYLAFVAAQGFIGFGLYSALEAGLSSYLYGGLKPVAPPPAA
ncbi:MAG TPA: hypothetical protein PLK37_06575 [Terricaulis sp.]|nr:hypothetical protein [Terricaulis sp.]